MATASHPSICTLPAELVQDIAKDFNPHEALALKLTCRDLAYNKMTDRFMSMYMRDLHFMISNPRAMAVLERISEHPVYNQPSPPHLPARKLSFNMAVLQPFSKWERDTARELRRPSQLQRQDNHSCDSQEGQTIRHEDKAHYRRCLEKQTEFLNTKLFVTLCNILQNFRDAGAIFDIAATTMTIKDHYEPHGVKALKRMFGDFCLLDWYNTSGPCNEIWRAILCTQYPVQKLRLGNSWRYRVDLSIFRTYGEHGPLGQCNTLKSLDISLKDPDRTHSKISHTFNTSVDTRGLLELLVHNPLLESLCLLNGCYQGRHRHIFRSLQEASLLPRLRHLTLEGHDVRKQVLLDVVQSHQGTLETMNLHSIRDEAQPHLHFVQDVQRLMGNKSFIMRLYNVYGIDNHGLPLDGNLEPYRSLNARAHMAADPLDVRFFNLMAEGFSF